MTLREKQSKFCRMIAGLIQYAELLGYELTFGDAYRDPRVFGELGERKGYGRFKSNHKLRLAVDFNLFKDGKYLTESEDYRFLAKYWESIGGSSGIDFEDANHFSLEHEGFK